jgi:hypothetical protein
VLARAAALSEEAANGKGGDSANANANAPSSSGAAVLRLDHLTAALDALPGGGGRGNGGGGNGNGEQLTKEQLEETMKNMLVRLDRELLAFRARRDGRPTNRQTPPLSLSHPPPPNTNPNKTKNNRAPLQGRAPTTRATAPLTASATTSRAMRPGESSTL